MPWWIYEERLEIAFSPPDPSKWGSIFPISLQLSFNVCIFVGHK